MLANWLIGDAFKMVFFFVKDSSDVPWAFKLCGVFQACCDCYLGVQYYMFGDGEPVMPNVNGHLVMPGINGETKAKMSVDIRPEQEAMGHGIEMNGFDNKI